MILPDGFFEEAPPEEGDEGLPGHPGDAAPQEEEAVAGGEGEGEGEEGCGDPAHEEEVPCHGEVLVEDGACLSCEGEAQHQQGAVSLGGEAEDEDGFKGLLGNLQRILLFWVVWERSISSPQANA